MNVLLLLQLNMAFHTLFGNWQELISSPEIDVVSIATPPSQQPAIISCVFKFRGNLIFCEKPVGWFCHAHCRISSNGSTAPNCLML